MGILGCQKIGRKGCLKWKEEVFKNGSFLAPLRTADGNASLDVDRKRNGNVSYSAFNSMGSFTLRQGQKKIAFVLEREFCTTHFFHPTVA